LTSIINVGVSVAVADATTKALFGTNVWNWLTDGWFGRAPTAATNNSWEISLYEIVNTATGGIMGPTGQHGFGSSGKGLKFGESVQKNLKANGAMAIGTVIAAPIAGKLLKRLARGPIRDANKMLKWSGISQATGMKI
jgi:hypothetical protein